MDSEAQRYVNYRNSVFGKTVATSLNFVSLSLLSPPLAFSYILALPGMGPKNYWVESHGDERGKGISVNKKNEWELHELQSVIRYERDIFKSDGVLVGLGWAFGAGLGFVANEKLYDFLHKTQDSFIDYAFSPLISEAVDLTQKFL